MSDQPANVLFVDHAEGLGGGEHSLLTLIQYLDRARVRPILACNEGPLAEEARKQRILTHIVPMPKIRGRPSAPGLLVRGAFGLARLIRRERIQVVHSNVMRASFYAAAAAKLVRRPFVWHVRDIYEERWYLRLMCRLCDRAIAVSRAAAAPISCVERTDVVHDGLDIAPFDRVDGRMFRAEIGLAADQTLVGIVGRVWPWKGQRLFLEAAARVTRVHPQTRFAVVGDVLFPADQDYLEQTKAYCRELGLSDRVIFTGHRRDVPSILAGLDLFVHASRAEPFGRVLIEAMAARRPIVAFNDGGVPEIVVHGKTGLLVSPGDVGGLATAIGQILSDPRRRVDMGHAGRLRVEERFTAERMARGIEAVYARLGFVR
jgi:glycosyltransferase involved in cell wall biosynthesis